MSPLPRQAVDVYAQNMCGCKCDHQPTPPPPVEPPQTVALSPGECTTIGDVVVCALPCGISTLRPQNTKDQSHNVPWK